MGATEPTTPSNPTSPGQILNTALAYIEAGLCVFPVHPAVIGDKDSGKNPRPDRWQESRLTADQFRAAYRPGDNLGVRCGRDSRIVCLDIDSKRGGHLWYEAHKHDLGEPLVELTGQPDSRHLYYRYPERLLADPAARLMTDHGLFPGVEFFGDGTGFLVTAPSLHHKGVCYRFPKGDLGLLMIEDYDELPGWVVDAALTAQRRKQERAEAAAKVDVPDGLVLDHPADVARATQVLLESKPPVEDQNRNTGLYGMGVWLKCMALSFETAERLVAEHYLPRTVGTPYTPAQARETLRKAYKYTTALPVGCASIQTEFAAPPVSIPADPAQVAADEEAFADKGYKTTRPVQAARLFLRRHRGQVLCQDEQLYVYRTDRLRWEPIKDGVFQSVVARDIEAVSPTEHLKLKMTDLANIVKAVKLDLDDQPHRLRTGMWLDRPGDGPDQALGEYVAVKNGIIDLQSGEVLPHTPQFFSYTTLPFDYDPEAKCPEFLGFLDSVWDGDQDLVRSLRRWVGYLLLSDTRAQKFAVLIGESRGGKSTLARVMEALIGRDNTAACSLTTFGGEHGLQQILTKRLAIFNDAQHVPGDKGRLAVERIISIVGNDPQPVNPKNRDIYTAVLPTKIVFVCNAMPPFINTKGALTNRMIVFPFSKSFAGREDPKLLDRLLAELPGILNWALDGVREVLAGEMPCQSEAGQQAVEAIGQMLDSVEGFVADVVADHPQGTFGPVVTIKEVWAAYKQWCQDNGITSPRTKKHMLDEFRRLLGRRAAPAQDSRSRLDGFRGIALHLDSLAMGDGLEPGHDPPPF